jgi:uncharacterized membrane protein YuzA (DUF378 family)
MTIKNKHFILLFIIVMLLNGLLVFATDYLLQKEKIYHPFSHIIKNYVTINKEDGSKDYIRESVPFVKITNNKYIVQDGSHYYNIKQHFYKGNDEKINFSRAFFPLFPIVWYLTHFSPIQITIFNYLVFILGLIIIVKLFQDKVPRWSFFLVLCMPMMVIYLLPMTEAIFFLTASIGIYGIIKNKYWIFFVGFFLASITKSSASIFIVAFFCAELLINVSDFKFKDFIFQFIKKILPILLGVFFVMLFQKIRGADSWFAFINAQKLWDKEFSFPNIPLSDWSEEGRSVTFPLFYMFSIPMIVVLIRDFIKNIKQKQDLKQDTFLYVKYLSMLYLVGNIIIAVFTQKGCLNSLARYLLCNPFFVFLLFTTIINNRKKKWQIIYIIIGIATVLLCLRSFKAYNGFGIYLVFLPAIITFFHRYIKTPILYISITILILLNIIWTAYLLNMYLSNAWIFT